MRLLGLLACWPLLWLLLMWITVGIRDPQGRKYPDSVIASGCAVMSFVPLLALWGLLALATGRAW